MWCFLLLTEVLLTGCPLPLREENRKTPQFNTALKTEACLGWPFKLYMLEEDTGQSICYTPIFDAFKNRKIKNKSKNLRYFYCILWLQNFPYIFNIEQEVGIFILTGGHVKDETSTQAVSTE